MHNRSAHHPRMTHPRLDETALRRRATPALAHGCYAGRTRDELPTTLIELLDALDACQATPGLSLAHGVTSALGYALATPDWLPADVLEAERSTYARRLVYGDPAGRYTLLAIAWGPGQHTPVHPPPTWCAVGVYRGALQEWHYAIPEGGCEPRLSGKKARRVGDCTFDPRLISTHRIANVTRRSAVSIHIYGIACDLVTSGVERVAG